MGILYRLTENLHGHEKKPPKKLPMGTQTPFFTLYTRGPPTCLHIAITWAASKLLIPGLHPPDYDSGDPKNSNVLASLGPSPCAFFVTLG